jgi:hypothetical protein
MAVVVVAATLPVCGHPDLEAPSETSPCESAIGYMSVTLV